MEFQIISFIKDISIAALALFVLLRALDRMSAMSENIESLRQTTQVQAQAQEDRLEAVLAKLNNLPGDIREEMEPKIAQFLLAATNLIATAETAARRNKPPVRKVGLLARLFGA